MKSPSELCVEVSPDAVTTAVVYPGADTLQTASGAPPPLAEPLALVRPHTLRPTLILGHGAGAGQRSPFMVGFARAIAALGIDVVTFNFLYTERGRSLPDRAPVLEACYRAAIDAVRTQVQADPARCALFVGGKSMGGRIATQVAAADREVRLAGLVLLGYPLHPPGRPEQRRDAHLPAVKRPMLFVQGSRDTFGTPSELSPVLAALDPAPTLHVVAGGDHSFKLSRADAAAQTAVYDDVQRTIADWMRRS